MSDTEQPKSETSSVSKPARDFIRDPSWHFWGAVLVGMSIIIGIITYVHGDWHKPVKALTCDILAVGPLVSVEDDVNHRVQVVFDHKPTTSVRFAVVRIANSGDVPIDRADFERPLALHLGAGGTSKILTAQLLSTYPGNIEATCKVSGDTVTLTPLLLNPDDNVTFRVIYTGGSDFIKPDARIVGIPSVTGTDPARQEQAFARMKSEAALLGDVIGIVVGALVAWALLAFYDRQIKSKMRDDPAFLVAYITNKKIGLIPFTDEYFTKLQRIQRILSEEAAHKKEHQA